MMIWWGAPIDGNLHKDHQLGPGCQVAKGAMDWAALEIWEESKKCLEVSGSRSWDMLGPCILSHVFLKSSEITISWVGKSNCAVDFAGPGNSMAKNTSHHLSVVDIYWRDPVVTSNAARFLQLPRSEIPWNPMASPTLQPCSKATNTPQGIHPGHNSLTWDGSGRNAWVVVSHETLAFRWQKVAFDAAKMGRVWMCYGFLGENRALSRLRTSIEGNKLL
jgi:hypothetical protein